MIAETLKKNMRLFHSDITSLTEAGSRKNGIEPAVKKEQGLFGM